MIWAAVHAGFGYFQREAGYTRTGSPRHRRMSYMTRSRGNRRLARNPRPRTAALSEMRRTPTAGPSPDPAPATARRGRTQPRAAAIMTRPGKPSARAPGPAVAALAPACPARPIASAGILPSPQSPVARPEAHTRTQPGDMPPGRADRTPTLHSGHRPQARAPSGLVAASGAGRCRRYAGDTSSSPHADMDEPL